MSGARTEILGIGVDLCSAREASARLARLLAGPGRGTVIPVNPEMVIAARGDAAFRAAINGADLVLADGAGVVAAARMRGHAGAERFPGVDAVEELARLAARDGHALFLLGAADGVAAQAAERLAARHPGLRIAGTHAGSPDPREEEAICAAVNASGAGVLLVAYGAPKQELWIARNRARLAVRLAMAVGGTFDFLAGVATRAPGWMRRAGLEWLYRLVREPRRWRRMLALPRFALLAVTERTRRHA